MRILNPENFKLMTYLKFSGYRILISSKITYHWTSRIQDPESSGLKILDKGPWILRIWCPQFFNTNITCQGHTSKVVQSIWNSKEYLKNLAKWQGQIWDAAKKTTASKSESDIIWHILPIKQNCSKKIYNLFLLCLLLPPLFIFECTDKSNKSLQPIRLWGRLTMQ